MSIKYHDQLVAGTPELATVVEAGNGKPVTSGAVKSAIDNPVAIKIEAASSSESVATYNARLDAVLATMENNSCKLVEAYPPQIWSKGVCLCVLYKYTSAVASLQTVADTSSPHNSNFVLAKNGGTWGDIEYFATKSAITTQAAQTYSPTLPTGVTVFDNGCRYYVTGSIVHLQFSFKITNATAGTGIGAFQSNIPSTVMPKAGIFGVCDNGAGTGYSKYSFSDAGKFTIYPQSSGTTYAMGWLTYPI